MAENNSWMIGYYYLNEWVKKNFEWVAHKAVHGWHSFKAVMGFHDHKDAIQSRQLENLKTSADRLSSFGVEGLSKEKVKKIQEKEKSGFRSDTMLPKAEPAFSF